MTSLIVILRCSTSDPQKREEDEEEEEGSTLITQLTGLELLIAGSVCNEHRFGGTLYLLIKEQLDENGDLSRAVQSHLLLPRLVSWLLPPPCFQGGQQHAFVIAEEEQEEEERAQQESPGWTDFACTRVVLSSQHSSGPQIGQ